MLTCVRILRVGITSLKEKDLNIFLDVLSIIRIIHFIRIILQVDALLKTLEMQGSAHLKGHFSLFNCLVIGHTKYKGVQRAYCNPFQAKRFHGSHRLDLVMIRPPGIDNGAFAVSPDSVWYARVLLLFSASAIMMTDTRSKTFECALVSTLETYDDPDNGNYIHYSNYTYYAYYNCYLPLLQLCMLLQ
jgi:hypothetical protein